MVPIAPDSNSSATSSLWGTVVAVQANYYWVSPDFSRSPESRILCTRRARLKKLHQQVMVGDHVRVEKPDWEGARGAIAEVQVRSSQLDRPPVANAHRILLVFAMAEPALAPHQLTRFLVKAELTGLEIVLCLNKRDLVTADFQIALQQRLRTWGYLPVMISAQQDTKFASLTAMLAQGITVISGPSGVGKSSLINRLIPTVALRTNAVSGRLGRGRHTTRHTELFTLQNGGLLADTPGFNQPDIPCSPESLGNCFPEIRIRLQAAHCQFSNCLHQGEPGCVVEGSWERYSIYRELLEECKTQWQTTNDSPEPEAVFKAKAGASGKSQQEPRLAAKTYRRTSRRSRHQAMHTLRNDLPDTLEALEALDAEDLDAEL